MYLFTVPWSLLAIGGVNEVVKNLYRSLAEAGPFTPAVLTSGSQSESAVASTTPGWRTACLGMLSPFETYWKARLAFALYLPVTLFRLTRLIRRMRVHVVNPHFPGLECIHFSFLRWLGLFRGRIILSFHGSDVLAISRTKGFERLLWRFLIRSADASVCCSHVLAQRLINLVPEAEKNISVIWNGIDGAHFLALSTSPPTGLPIPTGPYLLNIGAFDYRKGQDILISAFDILTKRYPDLKLIIAGRPMDLSLAMHRQIESTGLSDRVTVIEDLPHSAVPDLMRHAQLFVLPSRTEGFPLVLLEAGVLAKPVVATAVGGVPELVTDRVNGRLVPAEDAQALARAIGELLNDDQEALRLGEALRRRVAEQFTLEQARDRYLELSCN